MEDSLSYIDTPNTSTGVISSSLMETQRLCCIVALSEAKTNNFVQVLAVQLFLRVESNPTLKYPLPNTKNSFIYSATSGTPKGRRLCL